MDGLICRSSHCGFIAVVLVIIAGVLAADPQWCVHGVTDGNAFYQLDVGVKSRVKGGRNNGLLVQSGVDITHLASDSRGFPPERLSSHRDQTQNAQFHGLGDTINSSLFMRIAAIRRLGTHLAVVARQRAVDLDAVAIGVIIAGVTVVFILFVGALATFYGKSHRRRDSGRENTEEEALSGRKSSAALPGLASWNFVPFMGSDASEKPGSRSHWSLFDTAEPAMSRASIDSSTEVPLCPELVVQHTKGLTLAINGNIYNSRQNDMIYVHKCDDKGDLNQMLVEVKMAEHGESCGIYLESSFGFPIAFLNTKFASDSGKGRPSEARKVTIYKSSGDNWDVTEATVYAVVQLTSATQIDVKRVLSQGRVRQVMLSLCHENESSAKVVDTDGNFVAGIEFPDSRESNPVTYVNMSFGTDAGLVLSAVIASRKLITA